MQPYRRFDVEWIFGPNTYRYSTKTIRDIEVIGDCHYRVRTYSERSGEEEILEFVIRKGDGVWMIRSDKFEPEPECEFEYTHSDHADVWTEDLGTERMVIRAEFNLM